MKNKFGKLVSILMTGALLWQGAALADTIPFEGTVAASQTCEVYAFIGGTVSSVEAEVGQQVAEGDVLATLNTTKVYAAESGVVTGVFGQIGDSAETIASANCFRRRALRTSAYSAIEPLMRRARTKCAYTFAPIGNNLL